MTTTLDVLRVAAAELGTVEGPRPNEVKYNTWFYGRVVWGARYPWCAAFVCWVLDRAGIHEVRTASVLALMAHFKAVRRWHAGTAGMQPGDVVIYLRPDGEHTGIARDVLATSVRAIEGNTDEAGGRTGGKVMVKDRPFATSHIAGYGRPLYATAAAPSQPEDHDLPADPKVIQLLTDIGTRLTDIDNHLLTIEDVTARWGRKNGYDKTKPPIPEKSAVLTALEAIAAELKKTA